MSEFRSVAERVATSTAASRIAELGFLAGPDLPDRPGPAYLLIALRAEPTLRHYDPERIEFWVTHLGRGSRRAVTRDTPVPLDLDISWGMLRISDRVHATNEYLTFGGHLSATRVEDAIVVAVTSPAPLLCRGGHSQDWDLGSEQLAAFFGRVTAAIDVRPELETRFAEAEPLVRYSAFLDDVVARYRACPDLRDLNPRLYGLLLAEEALMRSEQPCAWRAGRTLLADLTGP